MASNYLDTLFPAHILQRGIEYYRRGRILEMQRHDNEITAKIKGTDMYTVTVTLDEKTGLIEDHSCDCPYGEDGTPCKHLAALLYMLEENAFFKSPEPKEETTIEQAIALLSDRQMRELLIQFASSNSHIREKILLTATKQIPTSLKAQWECDLLELTDSAADRHGFISYDEASAYCSDLQWYMEDRLPELLDTGLVMDAFDLTCLVFQTAMEQDMDDSDGGLTVLADACMDAWTEILNESELNDQKEMFKWFATHYSNRNLAGEFLKEYLFAAPWEDELVPELMHFLDQQIQNCLEDSNERYHTENLIKQRIRWMERIGTAKSEIEKYMMNYHHFPGIRKMQISQAMREKDYKTALVLLDESKELDKDKFGLVAEYSARKIEIFETTNNAAALLDELKYYVFTFCQDNLLFIEKLKALLTPPEWLEVRTRLLNSRSMKYLSYSLMESEGMYEQLMERIEANADLYSLEQYESFLKDRFAARCVNIYLSHLRQSMNKASNRKAYRSIIQTLKRLLEYPDGKATAQRLANEWKRQYARRSSMLDELNKAGF